MKKKFSCNFQFFQDVEILAKKLPNVVENNLISTKRLNHLDLIYGRSVRTLVFDRVMELINLYRDGAVKSTEKVSRKRRDTTIKKTVS